MSFKYFSYIISLRIVFLFSAFLLAGCGTFQVELEPTNGPEGAEIVQVETPAIATATASPTVEPTATAEHEIITTEETVQPEEIFTITGRAMTIDPSTGSVLLIPEIESPFADNNGAVRVRISDWAHIVDTEGAIVNMNEFSRGIKLELKLLFQDGQLTSEEVLVLERGVPPPEENPAYTDVTGLVTPLAEPPSVGEGAISLFEVGGAEGVVDPGSPLTLNWAFSGEYGSICVDQIPRPVTYTCYQDLPPSGSMPVTVPADAREAIIYSLYVELDEEVESADVRVPISQGLGCTIAWFFETEALLGCAAGQAVATRPQAQIFEEGMMLRLEGSWLGEEPYLFAFLWEQDRDRYGFTEGPLLDPWSSDMSERVVGEEAPEGLFSPTRGFGLLWSGQIEIEQMGEPRTIDGLGLIGWAIGPVFEYDAQYQCAEEFFGNSICYLSLPDGQIVGLPGQA